MSREYDGQIKMRGITRGEMTGRDTQLGIKVFREDNLSKEQAVVYLGQMGPKWQRRETRE